MSAAAASERNKLVVRRALEEIWNSGNLAVADELYDANARRHDPANPDIPPGPEGVKQLATRYRNAFTDLYIAIEDEMADGDKVITRWRSSGTHHGDLKGLAATGKHAQVTGITIARLAEGRIVEEWVHWDNAGLMRQLGVTP